MPNKQETRPGTFADAVVETPTLKLSDENSIDAAGDRMTVSFQVSRVVV